MPRSLWSGALSFGLVNVPVRLVSAVRQREVRFHQVHEADGGRIKYKRVYEAEEREVPYEEIAKVYDADGGAPVMITGEEIESVEAERSELIEISDFVKLDQVDPIYFEKPYYLVPDKGGDKAYRLLVESMRDSERIAIATFVFRGSEKLVAIRAFGGALTLTTLNYGDEVVMPEDLEGLPQKTRTPAKERKMAEALIDALAAEFDPHKYRDAHRERVLDLIEAKRAGGILLPTTKPKREATTDLAAALEQTLASLKAKKRA